MRQQTHPAQYVQRRAVGQAKKPHARRGRAVVRLEVLVRVIDKHDARDTRRLGRRGGQGDGAAIAVAHQDVRARSERRQQRIQIPGDAFQRARRGIVIAASQIGTVVDHRPKPPSDKGLHQTPCRARESHSRFEDNGRFTTAGHLIMQRTPVGSGHVITRPQGVTHPATVRNIRPGRAARYAPECRSGRNRWVFSGVHPGGCKTAAHASATALT
ncbi:Uncharacterised protein [Mycobacteroides abscessus subsp. abscessus]|nr:Uncharacterised protein [Mycobacteroides abscessus subsp. abscessus]